MSLRGERAELTGEVLFDGVPVPGRLA